MKNKDNVKTLQDDGAVSGTPDNSRTQATKKPAPKEADYESEMTPPENEIYVDLEPEELSLEDDPLDVNEPEK